MASSSKCVVCFEHYERFERKPVVWPICGHTLCQPCATSVWAQVRDNPSSGAKFVCPICRQEAQSLEQLAINRTVLDMLDELRSLEARGSGPQTLRSNSVRLMRDLNASFRRPHTPSTPQPAQQSQTMPALVAQLQSPDTPEQQLAALQALSQATKPTAGPAEAPQGDGQAADGQPGDAIEVKHAACGEAASAGAIPALIAILSAAASTTTTTSSSNMQQQQQQIQALAAEVLCHIMLDSVARQRAALEAGLVPVAARLLGRPFPGNTELPLPVVLLAICDRSDAADVKAAVGQAAAVRMMQSSDPELQTAGLQLLGHVLTTQQQQEQGQQQEQEQAGLAGTESGVDSAVVGLLGSIDEDVQAGAVTLLQSLAGESQHVSALLDAQVVPRLVRMVHTPRLSEGVVRTLRRIASNSSREPPALQGHASNPQAAVDELCREGALRAVVQLLRSDQGSCSSETVQHAVHLLFTCSCASLSAARVIYRAGGCQVLQGLLGHADESIRDTAAATLRHIQATR